MKIITLQNILQTMEDDAKGNRGCGIMMLVFLGGIVVMSGAAFFTPYALIPILLFGVPGVGFLIKSKSANKGRQEKVFYLVTDTCRGKDTEICGEEGDAYILIFESGVKHTINTNDVALSTDERLRDDEWLYSNTELGDSFYLVYMEGEKRPEYIFPQKLCQLDMTGFVEENGRIRPWKAG